MLRYLTAGESHGPALVVVVEGLPAGLAITVEQIGDELAQKGIIYAPDYLVNAGGLIRGAEYMLMGRADNGCTGVSAAYATLLGLHPLLGLLPAPWLLARNRPVREAG